MKTFIVNKVGYSAGIYGCSDEYFSIVAIDGDRLLTTNSKGMYGIEYRLAQPLKEAGFTQTWASVPDFGRLPQKTANALKVNMKQSRKSKNGSILNKSLTYYKQCVI